jgi:hypothetical protein
MTNVNERAVEALETSGLSAMAAYRLTGKEWLLELNRHVLSDADIAFLADLTALSAEWIKNGVEDERIILLKKIGILK